jgi:hypothetical protein
MKRVLLLSIATVSIVLFVAALPQQKSRKALESQRRTQLEEMMKDPAVVNFMMDRIASNNTLRSMMMQKMIRRADSDSTWMGNMVGMMNGDYPMHSMMMQMMTGQGMMYRNRSGYQGMMNNGGMMSHRGMMMQDDSSTHRR